MIVSSVAIFFLRLMYIFDSRDGVGRWWRGTNLMLFHPRTTPDMCMLILLISVNTKLTKRIIHTYCYMALSSRGAPGGYPGIIVYLFMFSYFIFMFRMFSPVFKQQFTNNFHLKIFLLPTMCH